MAAAADPEFAPLSADLAPLDLYYITGGVASRVFTEEDSERALRLAGRALDAARAKVPAR